MVKTLKLMEHTKPQIDHAEVLRNVVLPVRPTLLEAIKTLDRGGVQIALAVDSNSVLVGVMTDGDVRRAFLQGANPCDDADAFLNRDFLAVSEGQSRAEVLDLMQCRRIRQIPIIDRVGRLCGLHLLDSLIKPARLPNTAVVLAGGQGLRLRPYTENVPKPMLRVAGRPILERLVLHLAGSGIESIVLATNYLSHIIEEHFQDGGHFGCRIEYLKEEMPLGTAGPLRLLDPIPQSPILVLNGDLVTQFEVNSLLRQHRTQGNTVTMGVKLYGHRVPYGCVTVEGARVTRMAEKPMISRLVNAGIYVVEPEAVSLVPSGQSYHMTDLIEALLAQDRHVGYFELTDDWVDVGQKENLEIARGAVL